jgi:shikimate dehydrogenase
MHRAALDHIGREGDYETREVDLDGFLSGVIDLREHRLDGANVTMPHKRTAYEVCDQRSDGAIRVGAVNTMYVSNGLLIGDNTDIAGVAGAWTAAGLPADVPVIILGAGGAAAAALAATAGRQQYMVARRPEAAQSVVARVGTEATVIEWGEPVPAGVVVNATSLGMRGERLPDDILAAAVGLLDMPYRDSPTPAVVELGAQGVPVADGLDMLVGQAVGSFLVWTGMEVDQAVFRTAAEQELQRRVG